MDYWGEPHSEEKFLSQLKTNEEDNPNTEIIRSFAQEIANASPTELKNVITSRMNITEIISLAVVDRIIRNDDDVFIDHNK